MRNSIFLSVLFMVLITCASTQHTTPRARLFEALDVFPEGIAYDEKTQRVFVSSMKYGTVGTVSQNNVYSPFIQSEDFISTSGITVDAKRRRLFIAIVDPGVGIKTRKGQELAFTAVAVYDIDSKKRVAFFPLHELYEGKHFANEIDLAEDGSAYVSDSFSPVIYKLSSDLSKAEVFVENKALWSGEGFNLNGIAVHGKGAGETLIALKYNTGQLFNINVAEKTISEITLPQGVNMKGADGLVLYKKKYALIVHNAENDGISLAELSPDMRRVVNAETIGAVDFENGMATMQLNKSIVLDVRLDAALNFPTTVSRAGKNSFYVLNAALGELFAGKSRNAFSIMAVTLK